MSATSAVNKSLETSQASNSLFKADEKPSCTPGSYLLVALGIIVLLGSLAASGYFFSQMGYSSLALGGGGAVASILCFALSKYCTMTQEETSKETAATLTKKTVQVPQELPQTPIPSSSPALPKNPPSSKSASTKTPPLPLHFFPKLSSIKLEDSHPLMTDLNLGSTPFDEQLLNTLLEVWRGERAALLFPEETTAAINDPKNGEFKKLIDARIEEFDRSFQLRERFKNRFSPLQVRDLISAWPQSRLRIGLMMNDEVAQLTVSDLKSYDSKTLWNIHSSLFVRFTENQPPVSLPASDDEMQKVLLIDLLSVKAADINATPGRFPPITFLFISRLELQKVDPTAFSTESLQLLLQTFDTSHAFRMSSIELTPAQINACVEKITDRKLFSVLSKEQMEQFDDAKMDQEIFNAMASKLIPLIDLARVYKLSSYFSKRHWGHIHQEQIPAFDFSKVVDPKKRQDAFNYFYSLFDQSLSKAAQLIPQQSLDWIYANQNLFSDQHWKYLGEHQILTFDYSQIPEKERNRVFNHIFSTAGEADSSAAKYLKRLPPMQRDIVKQSLNSKARGYLS